MTPTAIHAHFAALPGAEQIASAFACEGLAAWLRRRKPGTIYEIGAGIGTLSAVILSVLPEDRRISYTVEEPDSYCQSAWSENTRAPWDRAAKVTAWCPPRRPIDFLVVDGGDMRFAYYRGLARRAVIFFEGGRRPQRRACETALDIEGRAWAWAQFKPWDRSKGYVVYQLEVSLAERLWFWAVTLTEAVADLAARALNCPVGKKRRP